MSFPVYFSVLWKYIFLSSKELLSHVLYLNYSLFNQGLLKIKIMSS